MSEFSGMLQTGRSGTSTAGGSRKEFTMEEQSRNIYIEVRIYLLVFETDAGEVQAVRRCKPLLKEGEVLRLWESPAVGKAVLCKSLMKMLSGECQNKNQKNSGKWNRYYRVQRA